MYFKRSYYFHSLIPRYKPWRNLFVTCGCLLILFLLHDRFIKEALVRFRSNSAPKPSLRIHVSNIWVLRDDNYFTNQEHEELLTSSLRSQHFEPPSDEELAISDDKYPLGSPWNAIIEGDDDYFALADNKSDFDDINQIERPKCGRTPVRNILFLKTHYTGSEVVTNIINRFANLRDLLVALPTDGLSSFYWPRKFHWRYMDMKRLQGNLPHVLCNHARYNAEIMETFMPFNTHYVTILRNPVDYFMTVFKKLGISTKMDLGSSNTFETFILNPERYIKKAIEQQRFFDSMNLLKSGMFFDLGLHTSEYNQELAISSAIFDLQKRFSLVLIHEYLDESLVLLKRKFCWHIDDVIYLSSSFPRAPSLAVGVSSKAKVAIAKWNKADWMLYEFFNATLWENIRAEKNFYSELAAFRARRKQVELYCLGDNKHVMSSPSFDLADLDLNGSLATQFKPEDICKMMAMSTRDYLEYFRNEL